MHALPLMKKPYVITHTLTSLDGSVHSIELPEFDSAALQYEQLALHADQQVLNIDPAGRRGWQETIHEKDRLAVRPPCRCFPVYRSAHPATPDALVRVSQRTQRMQNRPAQP